MGDLRVTVQDFHELGYCGTNSRIVFNSLGWDWSDFVFNGIPAQTLIDTGDAMALAVVEHARQKRDM